MFVDVDLAGFVWLKTGLVERANAVVVSEFNLVFSAPRTVGVVPSCMFIFASISSILLLFNGEVKIGGLAECCFLLFGEGSAVFSISLISAKRKEALKESLVEEKRGSSEPLV